MTESKYKVGDVVDVNYEGTKYTSEIKNVEFIGRYFYYTVENVNNLPHMRMYTNMDESRIVGLHKESKAEEEAMSDMYPVGTYVVYDFLGDMGVSKIIGYDKNTLDKNVYVLNLPLHSNCRVLHSIYILCSIDEARIVGNVGKESKEFHGKAPIPKFNNGDLVWGYTGDNSFVKFEIDGIFINGDGDISYYDKDGEDYPESSVYKTKEECIEYVKSTVTFD